MCVVVINFSVAPFDSSFFFHLMNLYRVIVLVLVGSC